jgi:hypothetical protein
MSRFILSFVSLSCFWQLKQQLTHIIKANQEASGTLQTDLGTAMRASSINLGSLYSQCYTFHPTPFFLRKTKCPVCLLIKLMKAEGGSVSLLSFQTTAKANTCILST